MDATKSLFKGTEAVLDNLIIILQEKYHSNFLMVQGHVKELLLDTYCIRLLHFLRAVLSDCTLR